MWVCLGPAKRQILSVRERGIDDIMRGGVSRNALLLVRKAVRRCLMYTRPTCAKPEVREVVHVQSTPSVDPRGSNNTGRRRVVVNARRRVIRTRVNIAGRCAQLNDSLLDVGRRKAYRPCKKQRSLVELVENR